MAVETVNVADLTLESVRRLESDLKSFSADNQAWQAEMRQLITADLYFTRGLDADLRGVLVLYQANETRAERIEAKLDRVLARLEIAN